LEELFERAQKIDRESINQRSRENFNNRTFFRSDGVKLYPRKDKEGDVQMIGAKVDPEKARQERLCFNCGKQGHQARSCKAKKKNQMPRIRMVRAADIADPNRRTILDFEPRLIENNEDSYDSSMMRELLRKEVFNT
jgi:zinc knuckle protein